MDITPDQSKQIGEALTTARQHLTGQLKAMQKLSFVVSHNLEALADELANTTGLDQVTQRLKVLSEELKQVATIPPGALSNLAAARATMSLTEARSVTGLASSTLYNLVSQGRLPAIKSGKYLRFDPEALAAWVAQPRHIGSMATFAALVERMGGVATIETSDPAKQLNVIAQAMGAGVSVEFHPTETPATA